MGQVGPAYLSAAAMAKLSTVTRIRLFKNDQMNLKEIEGAYYIMVQPEMYPQGAPVDYSEL